MRPNNVIDNAGPNLLEVSDTSTVGETATRVLPDVNSIFATSQTPELKRVRANTDAVMAKSREVKTTGSLLDLDALARERGL